MEQKILAFMKENGIAVFVEADQTTGAGSLSRSGGRVAPDVCSPGWIMAEPLRCFSTVSCRGRRSQSGSGSWTRRCARFIYEQNK